LDSRASVEKFAGARGNKKYQKKTKIALSTLFWGGGGQREKRKIAIEKK